ncbi:MAG TPA: hypothetical protein PKV72_00175 [Candidatus Peribacteria bacterium]|nr:hypothetical protein [Candidatus Peribacteria bacterium]
MKSFRFPPDSPYREQRLVFQQANPENRNEPIPFEQPEKKTASELKDIKGSVKDALGNPEARAKLEQKVFQLRANLAVNKAFQKACENRTFARESSGRTYGVAVGIDGRALVYYNTTDGRHFTAATQIDLRAQGVAVTQGSIVEQMQKVIVNDAFSEVIAPQIKNDND